MPLGQHRLDWWYLYDEDNLDLNRDNLFLQALPGDTDGNRCWCYPSKKLLAEVIFDPDRQYEYELLKMGLIEFMEVEDDKD